MRSRVPTERVHAMVHAGLCRKVGGSMSVSRTRAAGETVLRVVPVADPVPALVQTRSHDVSQSLRCVGGCSQDMQAGGVAAATAVTHTMQGAGRRLPPRVRAFDTHLNPIRATVDLDLTVLTYQDLGLTSVGGAIHLAHHLVKEAAAVVGGIKDLSAVGLVTAGASIGGGGGVEIG